MDTIQRGGLGDLPYIRAQWHRGNLPGGDNWQMPMPKECKPDDLQADKLLDELTRFEGHLRHARGKDIEEWAKKVAQKRKQIEDKVVDAAKFGYQPVAVKGADGKTVYQGPPMEGADPMAALGPDRWRFDGRAGQSPVGCREHFHFGHARWSQATSADRLVCRQPPDFPARPGR